MSGKLPDVSGDAFRGTPFHAHVPLSYGVTVTNVRCATPTTHVAGCRSTIASAVGHDLEPGALHVDQAWELAACEAVAAAELEFAAKQNVQEEELTQDDTIGFPSDDDSDYAPATTTDGAQPTASEAAKVSAAAQQSDHSLADDADVAAQTTATAAAPELAGEIGG